MKAVRLCLLGIVTLFLTTCTVGVSTNKSSSDITSTDSINNLTVTFDFNGGTYNDSSEQVIFDDVKPTSYWKYVKARLMGTITPPDHTTFKGFSLDKDDPNIISDSYVIKEDMTVYAQYKVKEGEYCTVNWLDGETSETIKTETYFEGDTPTFKGTIPYHEGETFDHWEGLRQIEASDLGKSVDITAIYVSIYHDVTLDYYGDGLEKHIQTVAHNGYVAEPKIIKEGYKLDKWEYVSGGSGDFDFNTPIIEDIEIKAHWVKATYTVTWLNYDGTPLEAKTKEYEEGQVPAYDGDTLPTRESDIFHDYEFTGQWLPTPSEIHSDMTYVAVYQTHFYRNTEAYMRINIVDGNKDFTFTCTAESAESNITVDWGDGVQETKQSGTRSHTYTDTGNYRVRILNPITTISVSSNDNTLIEDLYLGENITSIKASAFNNCSNLKSVAFEYASKLSSFNDNAFSGCSSLTSITIPSSVTSLGEWAFYGCSNLETVTFEEESKLKSIGQNAFDTCSSLTSITIPSSVTSIGAFAFQNCRSLNSVIFANSSSLTSISDRIFYGCSSLTSITILSGVTSIGDSAFSGCSKLQTVTFENESKLKSIGNVAFSSCSALTRITIPSSVTSIGNYAFDRCSNLKTVDLTALDTPPTLGAYAFRNCHANLKLYVKENMVQAFKVADGWKEYKDIITDDPVPSMN